MGSRDRGCATAAGGGGGACNARARGACKEELREKRGKKDLFRPTTGIPEFPNPGEDHRQMSPHSRIPNPWNSKNLES